MNLKKNVLFISKEDTVIRSALAIHTSCSSSVPDRPFIGKHTFIFVWMKFASRRVFVTYAETPISMATCWALSRYSWRDCHSYNSGNPIGPEHHILPVHIKPLISHFVCVRVRVRKCGHSYFLRIIKAQIQSHHLPVMLFDCWDERLQNASVHILQDVSELR